MPKIGIFSGTFDPIHNAHLQFARQALAAGDLQKVFFLVEPRPRRKQGVKAFNHRLNMLNAAIKNEPTFGSIVLEQARFTAHETLPILQARFQGAGLYMLMGDDMLQHLGDWPHIQTLFENVNFIIGVRGEPKRAQELIHNIQATRSQQFTYQLIASDLPAVSSSRIRQAIRSGQPPAELPAAVLDYIKTHGLYTSAEES